MWELRINNIQKKSFEDFLDITERKIETLQAAAVVDFCHAQVTKDGNVVSNFALAISVRDLYEQCCNAAKENLSNDNIPSLSWFRFQFWPLNPYTHTALNYTGRLRIKCMVQQRTVCKFSEDNHYCSDLYKYARELAIRCRKFTSFLSTDDKSKIKCGETGCLISAVTCREKVLVGKDQIIQSAGHDFFFKYASANCCNDLRVALFSWSILVSCKPYVYIKITAIEPSSVIWNSVV